MDTTCIAMTLLADASRWGQVDARLSNVALKILRAACEAVVKNTDALPAARSVFGFMNEIF